MFLGRTYELVDQLASETEYFVILPDFFRGVQNPPFEDFEWEKVVKVHICPYPNNILPPLLPNINVIFMDILYYC